MITLSISQATAHLEAVLDRIVDERAPVRLVRPEGEAVLLVAEHEWAGLHETLHLLSSPANAKRLLDSIRGFDAGSGEELTRGKAIEEILRPPAAE
jgi:antitoxin YefM